MANEAVSLDKLIQVTEGGFPTELMEEATSTPPIEEETPPQPDPEEETPSEETSTEEEVIEEPQSGPEEEEETPTITETEEEEEEMQEEEFSGDLKSTFDLLKESGYLVLPDDYEFDNTPEGLEQAVAASDQERYKKMFDSLWNTLDEEGKALLKHKMQGGSLATFQQTVGVAPAEFDTSTTANQREIVAANLALTTKLSKDKINKLVDKLEASGELQSEAEDAVDSIKEFYSQQQAQYVEQVEQAKAQQRQAIQTAIESSEFIPEARRSQVRNYMINEVAKDDGVMTEFQRALAQISSNPEHLATLAATIYDTYKPNKGFDFSKFQKKGKTFEVTKFQKKLESAVSPKGKMKSGKTSSPSKKESAINWESFLQAME